MKHLEALIKSHSTFAVKLSRRGENEIVAHMEECELIGTPYEPHALVYAYNPTDEFCDEYGYTQDNMYISQLDKNIPLVDESVAEDFFCR